MDFSLITDHPDFKDIIDKIMVGESPKDICNWLKVKYPDKDQKHLQISAKSLQDFIDKHDNVVSLVKRDIAMVKVGDEQKVSASLLSNKTYRERILELAKKDIDKELDIKKTVAELVLICRDRMEQVFDKIQENPTNTKADYVLLKYFETLFLALEKFDKISNGPEQVIHQNFTIQILEQHSATIVDTIRETLAEVDPDVSLLFMEKLSLNLGKLREVAAQASVNQDEQLAEAKLLLETVPSLPK